MAKEVAVKDGQAGELRPFQRFIQYVQDRAELDEAFDPTDDLVEGQADRILNAENIDALFDAMELSELKGFRDLENGTELTILDYRLVKSNRDDLSGKLKAFAIVNVVDLSSGEEMTLNTSVLRIVSFLRKVEIFDLFPIDVRVVKDTTTRGNDVITLAKIKARSVKSQTV